MSYLDEVFKQTADEGYFDFTRCQRADGSHYGTGGTCRKGDKVGAREVTAAPAEKASRLTQKKIQSLTDEQLKSLIKNPKLLGYQRDRLNQELDKRNSGSSPKPVSKEVNSSMKVENLVKPKLGGELTGSTERITGGEPRKTIEEKIKYLEGVKKKYPDDSEMIDFDLNRLNKELNKYKVNEKIIEGFVANVPAGTKVFVNSKGYIETEYTTSAGHKVRTLFGQKNFNFQVNDSWNVGTVTDRREQIGIANVVRRSYEALVKALPEGAVVTTKAWTEDGRGQSRMDAYIKMGFSKPRTTKYGDEVDGLPGMNQYAKKNKGKMIPSSSAEEGLDRTYDFNEGNNAVALWYTAIWGRRNE